MHFTWSMYEAAGCFLRLHVNKFNRGFSSCFSWSVLFEPIVDPESFPNVVARLIFSKPLD